MKKIWRKLSRMFAAMSYAEAGNFDAVREILDENATSKNGANEIKAKAPASPAAMTGMADSR